MASMYVAAVISLLKIKDIHKETSQFLQDIDIIFGNIEDIAEMSTKLIVMLEEAAEMTDESNPVPLIGNCFEVNIRP